MKHFCLPVIFISLFLLGACLHTSHKKEGYRQVATHTVEPKGDQSWVFFGRSDAKAETPVLWPPHVQS